MPMTLLQITPERVIEFASVHSAGAPVALRLKNVTAGRVAFKIKTTAPRSYLVKPSSGLLEPGVEQSVLISFQSQQLNAVSVSDRFLVQATDQLDNGLDATSKDFWSKVPKAQVQDQRLNVAFKAEGGEQQQQAVPPSGIAPPPIPARQPQPPTGGDYENKYNDLLQYCMALEKQKGNLTKELDTARGEIEFVNQRLSTALCRGCGGKVSSPPVVHQGFELWQVFASIVAVVIVLKVFNML